MTDRAGKRTEMVARISMGKVVIVPAWTPRPRIPGTDTVEWKTPRGVGRPVSPRVVAAELARFLAARPRATKSEHRAAANAAGFYPSDSQWDLAYGTMPKELKFGRGRPKKSGNM